MHSLTTNGRKLWTMTCESLFQIMASSLSPEALKKLCRKHQMARPEKTRDKAELYQWAHAQCHRDSRFSRQIQRYLNCKHAAVLARFESTSPEGIQQIIEAVVAEAETSLPQDIAGIIWAAASDPRQAIRPLEKALINGLHVLSHRILLDRFRGEAYLAGPEKATPACRATGCDREMARLQTECQELRTSCTRLQRENDRLKGRIQALTHNYEALQHRLQTAQSPAAAHGAVLRDLKKLRYQVTKLTTLADDKERAIQALHLQLQSHEVSPKERERPHSTPSVSVCEGLQGKKVALIGGLGRATPHYLHTIQELGGCCLYHDGAARQGEKRLAAIIKQADIVLCLVDRNSHAAATSTKKLCKASRKPCYFLRRSGISHVRDTLQEITLQT